MIPSLPSFKRFLFVLAFVLVAPLLQAQSCTPATKNLLIYGYSDNKIAILRSTIESLGAQEQLVGGTITYNGVTTQLTSNPFPSDPFWYYFTTSPAIFSNTFPEASMLVVPPVIDFDGDGYTCDVDCNDNNPTVYPNAPENICDGLDNNCNGIIDEAQVISTRHIEVYGYGDNRIAVLKSMVQDLGTQEQLVGWHINYNGIDYLLTSTWIPADPYWYYFTTSPTGFPTVGATMQIRSTITTSDKDGDGYYCDVDCNDNNPAIHPGATEICDGIDNNCNGIVDEETINPIAVCHSITVHLGTAGSYTLTSSDINAIGAGSSDNCGAVTMSVSKTTFSCSDVGQPNNVMLTVTDHNGNSSTCTTTITVVDTTAPTIVCPNPITVNNTPGQCGAVVSFNANITDNCGLASVNYSHTSGSFFAVGTTTVTITAQDLNGNTSLCSFTVTVLAADVFYADADHDGFGNPSASITGCAQAGYVSNALDCDDANAAVNPNATELCYDGIDNNCNGIIDEGCTPVITVVQGAQCGTTLATIDQYIYANLVSGAQGYRFKVTDLTTNQVQTIDKALRVFQLTQLGNYAFNRTYQIEVSVRYNNVWQPFYGLPCTVTTPATTTQLQAAQCGSVLTNMNDIIYANNVPFAAGYRFRVTNLLTATQQLIDRPVRDIRLSLTSIAAYNASFSVEVAVKNTDGSYLPYGAACTVTTPSFPTTQLQLTQCDVLLNTMNTTVYADSFSSASAYRFKFTSGSFSYTFDRPTRSFSLSTVPGLSPATTYSVQVALEINGVFGPFGKVCTLTTPGGTRTATSLNTDLQVVAYPNPFADRFELQIATSSTEPVNLKVFDMLGKLVETRTLFVESADSVALGDGYPSGIYNLVVTQGNEVKTQRVIKR